jgi:hypothetical protein
VILGQIRSINALALGARQPTMHGIRDCVEAGGLMSEQASRISSGARPPVAPLFPARRFSGRFKLLLNGFFLFFSGRAFELRPCLWAGLARDRFGSRHGLFA